VENLLEKKEGRMKRG